MKLMQGSLAIVVSMLLAGCGNDDGGSSGGSPRSCQEFFSVDAVAAGDNCTPQVDTFCEVKSNQVLNNDPVPCDGVTTSEHEVTVSGTTMKYLAIRPSSGGTDTTVLALHYLGADTGRFSNVVRLSELAKARKVLVIAPQADALLLKRWPTSPGNDLDSVVSQLRAVLGDAKSRFSASNDPVYVSGLSNGAVMAYLFACRASTEVKAILAVSGELGQNALSSCLQQLPQPIGTVIVHGKSDLVTPYVGLPLLYSAVPAIHESFKQLNGCVGTDAVVTLPNTMDQLKVDISSTASCSHGRRDFLVTVTGGGHNWPGGSASDSDLSSIGLLGPHTRNFDATLQGFDLLRAAAGDD